MFPPADQKLFQIQTCQRHGYYAGHLPGARQALVCQNIYGTITVAAFDSGGHFRKLIKRNLPTELLTARSVVGYDVDEEGFQEYLKRELGFRPGVIRVREFRMLEEHLAVFQLPKYFEAFMKDPNDPRFAEIREELPSHISDWISSGSFILEWGNTYWLNREGECMGS
jgi:hypothetical protein